LDAHSGISQAAVSGAPPTLPGPAPNVAGIAGRGIRGSLPSRFMHG